MPAQPRKIPIVQLSTPDACVNPMTPITELRVAERTSAKQPGIMVEPLLPFLPSELQDELATRANYIVQAAKETPYYPRPSSRWGINE
jgi:hypothetical protein